MVTIGEILYIAVNHYDGYVEFLLGDSDLSPEKRKELLQIRKTIQQWRRNKNANKHPAVNSPASKGHGVKRSRRGKRNVGHGVGHRRAQR